LGKRQEQKETQKVKGTPVYFAGALLIALSFLFRKKIIREVQKVGNDLKLSQLHPTFQPRARLFIQHLEREGFQPTITSGFRSFEQQAQLYGDGKTTAAPGFSLHNYGLALDINTEVPRLRMASSRSQWLPVYYIAQNYGLLWGGDFTSFFDPVHFFMDSGFTSPQLLSRLNAGQVDNNGFVTLA